MAIGAGRLKDEVSSWPGVSVHPHRFAAREYRFGKAEVGHVHFWGDVDIPFPRPVHDFLLEGHLAEQHRWVSDSGWTTFSMRATVTSNMQSGSCDCPIFATRSNPPPTHLNCLKPKPSSFILALIWSRFSRGSFRQERCPT